MGGVLCVGVKKWPLQSYLFLTFHTIITMITSSELQASGTTLIKRYTMRRSEASSLIKSFVTPKTLPLPQLRSWIVLYFANVTTVRWPCRISVDFLAQLRDHEKSKLLAVLLSSQGVHINMEKWRSSAIVSGVLVAVFKSFFLFYSLIFNLQYVHIVIISESRRSGISYNISIRVKMRFFELVRSTNDDTIPF